MAIIIGAERTEEREQILQEAEVDLPNPASVPAQHRLLDRGQIAKLLSHESALVRTFALEQIARRDDEAWEDELIRLIDDEDDTVAAEAISLLGHRECEKAVEPILARFFEARGDVAAASASVLGKLAPKELLESLKQRGRLDDEAYAATATSLAIIGTSEVIEFLTRALNRAGALTPERRGTLYGAALLSGDRELSARVIGLAITDSQEEEPEGSAFPTRAALGALAGLPISMTSRAAGLELFDQCRDLLGEIVVPLLDEEQKKTLEEALKLKRPGQTLEALKPVLEVSLDKRPSASDEEKKDVVEELGTMPGRRRGFLEALIARADALDKLDLSAAALFVAAAVKAASVLVAGGADEVSSDAVQALAKALEGEVQAEKLSAMSLEELTELFRSKSPRDMRRVLSVITRESFHRSRTLARFARAAILAGHGKSLLETMGDIKDVGIQNPILDAFAQCPEQAEEAVVEIFGERPLPEAVLPYALAIAEEIRTERVGLAIARRFYDLRAHGRGALARTLLRVGDPRFIPLLESRAYPDEPEEVAWTALSLAHGAPIEGRLKEALDRSMRGREEGPGDRLVRLPLKCKRCKETLGYAFRRVYLDVEAKDQWADPAFVGEVRCKACGFDEEPFEPTEAAAQILTSHLMEFLSAARMGRMIDRPLVTPAQTEVGGRRVGFAAALRELDKDVTASPDAIRPRLHRARLLLMLERSGTEQDLEQVLTLDPDCIEAMTLRASVKLRRDDNEGAAEDVIRALRRLEHPEEPRFYDVGDVPSFRDSLEDLLVELRARGVSVPEDIDLSRAEARITARAQEILRMEEERRAAMEPSAPPPGPSQAEQEVDPAQVRRVGRNDPCPCGSGKKYKKCHGSR